MGAAPLETAAALEETRGHFAEQRPAAALRSATAGVELATQRYGRDDVRSALD
jgi:hypothetical protein